MLLEHTLNATIKFKPGTSIDTAIDALKPIAEQRGWLEAQILDPQLPMDDVVVPKMVDGFVKSITIYTEGPVGPEFEGMVYQAAARLGAIAHPGHFELRQHQRGMVDGSSMHIWFGPDDLVDRAKKAHAVRRVIPILMAAGVTSASHSAISKLADAMASASPANGESLALTSMSDLVAMLFVFALVFGEERPELRNLKDLAVSGSGEAKVFGAAATALKNANAVFALDIPLVTGVSYCFDQGGHFVGTLHRQTLAVDAFTPAPGPR